MSAPATAGEPARLKQPVVAGGVLSVNFFNGRLLTAGDLEAEQAGRRRELRRLGQALGEGVVHGLEVSEHPRSEAERPVLTIEPGLALSSGGLPLELAARTDLVLTADDPGTGGAGAPAVKLFAECGEASAGAYAGGAGVFVLAIGPARQPSGRSRTSGLGNVDAACNVDVWLEGVRFRLVRAPVSDEELADARRLRSVVAHLMFGTADPARTAFRRNPFGPRTGTYGLLDRLRAETLAADEVPLASLAWTPKDGIRFVDLWSVRRRPHRRLEVERVPEGRPQLAAAQRPALHSDRARADAEAVLLQFEHHVEDLRRRAGEPPLETLVAREAFAFLPPAGLLPLKGPGSPLGIEPERFFGAQGSTDGATLDGAALAGLFHEAVSEDPIPLDGAEPIQLYLVWDSRLAVDARTITQLTLVFARRTLSYRGVARFGFARYGRPHAGRR